MNEFKRGRFVNLKLALDAASRFGVTYPEFLVLVNRAATSSSPLGNARCKDWYFQVEGPTGSQRVTGYFFDGEPIRGGAKIVATPEGGREVIPVYHDKVVEQEATPHVITREELFSEKTQKESPLPYGTCESCLGTGKITVVEECSYCDGRGCRHCQGSGEQDTQIPCPDCDPRSRKPLSFR